MDYDVIVLIEYKEFAHSFQLGIELGIESIVTVVSPTCTYNYVYIRLTKMAEKTEENDRDYITNADGQRLFVRSWVPSGDPE